MAQSTYGILGDKLETIVAPCDPALPRNGKQVGGKSEKSRRQAESCGPKHPQHTARQVERNGRSGGEKCGTMQPRASIAYLLLGDSETQVGDKCRITRPRSPIAS